MAIWTEDTKNSASWTADSETQTATIGAGESLGLLLTLTWAMGNGTLWTEDTLNSASWTADTKN